MLDSSPVEAAGKVRDWNPAQNRQSRIAPQITRESNRVWTPPTRPGGFFLGRLWFNRGLRKGRRRFEIHARRRFSRKLGHSNPQYPIKSNVYAKLRRTAPVLWEEIAGAATFSRFVSTIPREHGIDSQQRCRFLRAAPDCWKERLGPSFQCVPRAQGRRHKSVILRHRTFRRFQYLDIVEQLGQIVGMRNDGTHTVGGNTARPVPRSGAKGTDRL